MSSMKYMTPDVLRSTVRVVVLGSAGVGKTTLIHSFLCRGATHSTYEPTATDSHHIRLDRFDLLIRDTGDMTKIAMRSVIAEGDAFLLVFSVESVETFDNIDEIREEIIAQKGDNVAIVVVGNLMNRNERIVSHAMADLVVSMDWGVAYHETNGDRASIPNVFMDLLGHPSISAKLRRMSGVEWNTSFNGRRHLGIDNAVLSSVRRRQSRNEDKHGILKMLTCWRKSE